MDLKNYRPTGPQDRYAATPIRLPTNASAPLAVSRLTIRHALISTSTPEGRSSLDNASTVREDDV